MGKKTVTVVVVDATSLERGVNLALQTLEITSNVIVCVNLLDEAQKKGIKINLKNLAKNLGVVVVGTSARSGKGLNKLLEAIAELAEQKPDFRSFAYEQALDSAINTVRAKIAAATQGKVNNNFVAMRLLENAADSLNSLQDYLGYDILQNQEIARTVDLVCAELAAQGIGPADISKQFMGVIAKKAEVIYRNNVKLSKTDYNQFDRKLDKVLTSKVTGIPIMILLLVGILWLTITGANYPSELLSTMFNWLEGKLTAVFMLLNAPDWLYGFLVQGVYRTLAWVVAVMLPPMAIFFPLFALLEDFGYLPRVAFNLDNTFRRCCAHGKQALTMCMGFGCNACGVVGCRIIDSPRERLIAIITNNFVPCNGRFPPPKKRQQKCSFRLASTTKPMKLYYLFKRVVNMVKN